MTEETYAVFILLQRIKQELEQMHSYVGETIDDETLFIDEHSLIEWIDDLLGMLSEVKK